LKTGKSRDESQVIASAELRTIRPFFNGLSSLVAFCGQAAGSPSNAARPIKLFGH
jgi:hypothetical protein